MLPLTEIDSLLQTLRSLSVHDEVEDLNILEGMIKSNTFKKAKHVCAFCGSNIYHVECTYK